MQIKFIMLNTVTISILNSIYIIYLIRQIILILMYIFFVLFHNHISCLLYRIRLIPITIPKNFLLCNYLTDRIRLPIQHDSFHIIHNAVCKYISLNFYCIL
jgi:hypothetical protein